MERIRVLLVDDHTIVRQGLRCILATDDEIEVVGEAGDGRSAVELTERLQPDVVVMDLTLPELNGIEATRRIFKQEKEAKELILTMHTDRMFVRQSLKEGHRKQIMKKLDLHKTAELVRFALRKQIVN